MDLYATHLEALVDTAMTTSGPVLELGCGDYSTPILLAITRAQGREFKCQASDALWASKYGNLVEVVQWGRWVMPPGKWGMVFLDSEENTLDRYHRLPALSESADAIVMHDANDPKRYAIPSGWKLTLHVKHKPHTAVFRRAY